MYPECFQVIRGVWPIIRTCLGYLDQGMAEFVCMCFIPGYRFLLPFLPEDPRDPR